METESDVFVLYDYNYDYRGKDVEIKQGEKLNLLQKTNQHWWKVSRPGVNKAFFVPAQYVEVIKTELQKGKVKKEEPSGTTTKIMTGSISHPISIPPSGKSDEAILSSTSSSPKSITIKRTDSVRTKRAAKLKNWSASLEELSKQIVFPGITNSVIDLTDKTRNKPVPLPRTAPPISFSNPGFNGGSDDSPVSTESLGPLPSVLPPIPKARYTRESDSGTSTEDILETKESPPRNLAASSTSSNETPPTQHMKSDNNNKSPLLPLAPSQSQRPLRTLSNNWAEFRDEKLKRFFYYNETTGQTSWKPPRNSSSRSFIGDSYESLDNSLTGDEGSVFGKSESNRSSIGIPSVSKLDSGPSGTPATFHIPEGWIETFDEATGQICYVNGLTGAKWFASQDPHGKIYFYEENSSKSSWGLPGAQPEGEEVPNDCQQGQPKVPSGSSPPKSSGAPSEALDHFSVKKRHSTGDMTDRNLKSRSVLFPIEKKGYGEKTSSLPRNSPSIWINRDELNILKEGPLNRTKIMENGKKLRKNWASVISVLSDSHLSLFKDQKMRNWGKSEIEIELRGSTLEWTFDGNKSRRKNVFQLTNRYFQILFQADDIENATEWYNTLNEHTDTQSEFLLSLRSGSPDDRLDLMPNEGSTKKNLRLYRNKSTKYKITGVGSNEEISDMGDITSIRAHLKKFFNRRPPRESLVKKGIYKDESVFGCNLEKLCQLEKSSIPRFVQECIAAIERGDNLKTDGIYRASGNLSQVQKIRLQVDQNNMEPVSKEEDVHVLAGTLKLFFREMREPLISCDMFERSLKACNIQKKEQKIREFREIISELPPANKATLQALLKHLLRVSEFADFNRMQIPNLAIVFGPTLMWPEKESTNMALDLMQQNLVVEALLLEYDAIFK